MSDDDDLLFEELAADVALLEKQIRLEDAQVWRRSWCRAIFAWIEGELASAKALRLTHDYWILEEEQELAVRDLRRVAAGTHAEKVRTAFLPLVDAAKLTVQAYAAHSGGPNPIAPDDPAWLKLATAVKIRNRVVHPKRHADLHMSDDEARLLQDASSWFFTSLLSVQDLYFRAEAHRLRARTKRATRYFRRHRKANESP